MKIRPIAADEASLEFLDHDLVMEFPEQAEFTSRGEVREEGMGQEFREVNDVLRCDPFHRLRHTLGRGGGDSGGRILCCLFCLLLLFVCVPSVQGQRWDLHWGGNLRKRSYRRRSR